MGFYFYFYFVNWKISLITAQNLRGGYIRKINLVLGSRGIGDLGGRLATRGGDELIRIMIEPTIEPTRNPKWFVVSSPPDYINVRCKSSAYTPRRGCFSPSCVRRPNSPRSPCLPMAEIFESLASAGLHVAPVWMQEKNKWSRDSCPSPQKLRWRGMAVARLGILLFVFNRSKIASHQSGWCFLLTLHFLSIVKRWGVEDKGMKVEMPTK